MEKERFFISWVGEIFRETTGGGGSEIYVAAIRCELSRDHYLKD